MRAFGALAESIEGGYDDFERVDVERAFAGLRRDSRYLELMKRYRSR